MKFIKDVFGSDGAYNDLLKAVKSERAPIACTGLSLIHKAALTAALVMNTGRKFAVITHDGLNAVIFR